MLKSNLCQRYYDRTTYFVGRFPQHAERPVRRQLNVTALCAGFLSMQDDQCAGNFGLFDMNMALEFVKENIKAFQGDPDRITIGGDTSGAAAVGFMLLSDMTRSKGVYGSAARECISVWSVWFRSVGNM